MIRLKLHEQARRRIERLIADRAIKSGTRIPTESELATELKVSRTTIRSALKVLEREGKIERSPGRGTILRQPRMGQLLGKLLSFSEEMKLRGATPSNRLIEMTQTMPSAPIRALLRLDGESVWRLRRVRCANGEPIAIETCNIPWSALSQQEAEGLGNGSLYDLLGQHGRTPVRSEQSAQAGLADAEEATLLTIETGRPVLRFERLSFDVNQEPIEFVTSTYRGDKYSFYVLLRK
jgi:GntR family transcriptional regulator, N-acetylglucosamine utilization regulator